VSTTAHTRTLTADALATFRRDHPLIAQIATALGFKAAEVDQVFISAGQL